MNNCGSTEGSEGYSSAQHFHTHSVEQGPHGSQTLYHVSPLLTLSSLSLFLEHQETYEQESNLRSLTGKPT